MIRRSRMLVLASVVVMLSLAAGESKGERFNPLKPPDRSSPRATLKSFVESLDAGAALLREMRSGGGSFEENAKIVREAESHFDHAIECLDLESVAPELVQDTGFETVLMLKDVLDRIPLPPYAEIPDADAMEAEGSEFWAIPDTEIFIEFASAGPHAGSYLFSQDTVSRIRDFFARVKDVPYRSNAEGGLYTFYISAPGHWLLPATPWFDSLPDWSHSLVLDQAVWQWLGLMVSLFLGGALLLLIWHWTEHEEPGPESRSSLKASLRPLAVMVVVTAVEFTADECFNITGGVLKALSLSLGAVFYMAGIGAVWLVAGGMAELLISAQHLRVRSIDSQLVRLGLRFVALIGSAAIAVEGAQRLGLPAYSVLTGLGIGGLAVALAARESMANLLGSIVIMFERPFRVGDWIQAASVEGNVEGVGFRSTRIRTFYDSLVSIPNSELVNTVVDNMGRRRYRRVKTRLVLNCETPIETVEAFTEGVRSMIRDDQVTWNEKIHVVVEDFGESGIPVLLYFFLVVPSWESELMERQRLLLEIMRLADNLGIRLAFPTQTVFVEGTNEAGASS
ncbi:mechanosensitive ion channel family protein [Myxococcota bacterium]|nr:mechanosensitive ion channel family protein [Myxococcota bacterium]